MIVKEVKTMTIHLDFQINSPASTPIKNKQDAVKSTFIFTLKWKQNKISFFNYRQVSNARALFLLRFYTRGRLFKAVANVGASNHPFPAIFMAVE